MRFSTSGGNMAGDAIHKSDLILDEIKRRRTRERTTVDVEDRKVKLVIFTLAGNCFAFCGKDVKKILPVPRIYAVPGSPDFILGVIHERGDVESVIAINAFLGLPELARTQSNRIAVAEGGGMRSGIMLEAILDVIDLPESAIKPPLPTLDRSRRELVTGETAHGDRNVTLLDIGNIFGRMAV